MSFPQETAGSFSFWCSLWILQKGHTSRPPTLLWTPGARGPRGTLFPAMQLQQVLLPTASPSTKLTRLWVLLLTCAEAVGLVPQQAEVAIHAVDTQRPLVSYVTLAGPVALSAAISVAVAIPATRPLRPTLAFLEDINLCLEHAPGVAMLFSHKENHSTPQSTCLQPNSLWDPSQFKPGIIPAEETEGLLRA